MIKKNIFILFLFVFAIFIFTGCSNVNNNNTQTGNDISRPAETTVSSSNVVGENGGEINASDKIKLNIPQGALNKETNIEITYNPNNTDKSLNSLGEIEFGPSGTKFDKPVEVKMKLNNETLNNELSVFYYDESNNRWEYVSEGNIKDGYVTFNINHFSKYQVVDITPAMLNRYVTIVKQAKANNKNDAWITETYYDYLKNELHLLDYYQEYDGLYYEACGLFISGSYQIDGNSGDPNELVKRYGESNKVGDTYGVSKIAGETVSYDEYKKNKENKESIDISITIDYKMIKPNITLSATKTTLDVGESATVNVYCHYLNNNNYFYKDFELPNYKLSVDTLNNNLAIDKKNLITNDSGNSSFKVTCMDDKKEIVTVIFEVSGDFGAYSSSSITFNDEGDYEITGHIVESLYFEYEDPDAKEEGALLAQIGKLKVDVEYDIEGSFDEENGAIKGSVNIKNAKINVSNTLLHYYAIDDGIREDGYLAVFETNNNYTSYNISYNIEGTASNNICQLKTSSTDKIVSVPGQWYWKATAAGKTETIGLTDFTMTVNTVENLLLPFELTEGENIYTNNKLLDTVNYNYEGQGVDIHTAVYTVIVQNSLVESTTQTITITKK